MTLAGSARADIHFTDLSGDPLTGNTIYYSLQNGTDSLTDSTGADFVLNTLTKNSKFFGGKGKSKAFNSGFSSGASTVAVTSDTFYEAELTLGTTIGASSTFGNNYMHVETNSSNTSYPGSWAVGDRGYLGLEISVTAPGAMTATTLYGWADVSLNSMPPVPPDEVMGKAVGPNAAADGYFTLYGFAYDDSGNPIDAGEIPEPGTMALLIAGAAGVTVLRRRRARTS